MRAYYNEIDPFAAEWLRNLIREGLIADGDVDERDIRDVRPRDVAGYTQCHFFAGIGVWSHSLRLAGWPDHRPVWTGSCPCQPFSAAGQRGGFDDERHLWPAWHWLVAECRPPIIFGEQVASSAAGPWVDLVQSDLEGLGYAFGAVPIPAAGVGAPHIRDRLWWVALGDASSPGLEVVGEQQARGQCAPTERAGEVGGMADDKRDGQHRLASTRLHERRHETGGSTTQESGADRARGHDADGCSALGGMADDGSEGRRQVGANTGRRGAGSGTQGLDERSMHGGPVNGFWADAEWLPCRDGKARPVEPGTFPLAHGVAARVGRLRAYGNAIVPQVAAEFISAFLD